MQDNLFFCFLSNPVILIRFINHCIFFTIRKKISNILNLVLSIWKKTFNIPFLLFFYESIFKLKPFLGFHYYILKRKNRKRIIKLKSFLLDKPSRSNKAVYWLYQSISRRKEFGLLYKILSEIYLLNYFNKSYALVYKITHYNTVLNYKLSKNFFW